MTTLDGVERTLTERRPPDLRRRTGRAGHRRDHGRRRGRGLGRPRPRSCWSRRTSRRAASRARRSGSGCGRRRARASSAASTRTTPGSGAARAMELLAAGRGRGAGRRARSTCIPSRSSPTRITVRTERVNAAARHRADRRRDRRVPHAARDRDRRHRGDRARRSAPTSSARSTSSRRSRARVGLDHIARTVPSNPEKIGGAERRASATGAPSPTCSSAPATTRCSRSRCSHPPTSPSAGRAARRRDRGREPAAGRGVDPAPRAPAGCAARGRVQRGARRARRRAVRERHRVRAARRR